MRSRVRLRAIGLMAIGMRCSEGPLGTLEPGKIADVVIADGDALQIHDLGNRIRSVYQDGVLVSAHMYAGRRAVIKQPCPA